MAFLLRPRIPSCLFSPTLRPPSFNETSHTHIGQAIAKFLIEHHLQSLPAPNHSYLEAGETCPPRTDPSCRVSIPCPPTNTDH